MSNSSGRARVPDMRSKSLRQLAEVVLGFERGDANLRLLARVAVETLNASQKHGREDDQDDRATKRAHFDDDAKAVDAAEVTVLDANKAGDQSEPIRPVKTISTRPTRTSAKLTIKIPPPGSARRVVRDTSGAGDVPAASRSDLTDTCKRRTSKVKEEDALERGTITTINGIKRWVCGICKRDVGARRSDAKQHLYSHDPEPQFHCKSPDCFYSTRFQSDLSRHMKMHNGKFVCGLPIGDRSCAFNCSSAIQLGKHNAKMHNTD